MAALKSSSSFKSVVVAAESLCDLRSRPFSSPRSFLRPPAAPRSIRSSTQTLDAGVSALVNPIILQRKRNWTISSSSPPLSAESEVHVETLGSQPEVEYGTKTVHVKFQLERACSYGEIFLLSGDDPIFGQWNPSNAIPLNWSEGHVWSIELDLPVGRTIQYKFILKCNNGDIKWQPGPDRIIKTWETNNTVVISEDWRFVRLQKITEVEAVAGEQSESIFQEMEGGSNGMAVPSDHLMEMKDGVVLITRGEAFPKEIPSIMVADAYVSDDDDEDPTQVPF